MYISIAANPSPFMTSVVRVLALTAVVILLGCAHRAQGPSAGWLPNADGWRLRAVEDGPEPSWFAYDRDAPEAKVKEIRVVGRVDAEPSVTMQALRHRLLAEEFHPDGYELEVLEDMGAQVVTKGVGALPWPFKDRVATERMRFSTDAETGVMRVDVDLLDDDVALPRGSMYVDLVRNTFVVAPMAGGGSVVTLDSVHDMGGAFPNGLIYAPVRKGMVGMLDDVRALVASGEWR